MVSSDLKSSYAPSLSDVKMLVIPISFQGSARNGGNDSFLDWNQSRINAMNTYYFGTYNSLSAYYQTASFDQLRITGKVTDIYNNFTISVGDINNDSSYDTLWNMMENALNWVQDNDTSINWSEYDLNQDGCVDNIHFITDFYCQTWNDPLWPHMYWTGRTGTLERPKANVYSISGTAFVQNAITAIHEQGHIFGLEDYYDYTTQYIDYVGQLDMQSGNVFDWNSFSKLSMGWVEPKVVTGKAKKTKVTLSAASLNGDCLIIPANYDTWNKSAFDEYFLLEYFAPYGNNEKDWRNYRDVLGSTGGVRLYHVDARVYGSDTTDPQNSDVLIVDDMDAQLIKTKEDVSKWDYVTKGCNNSVDYKDYEGGIAQLKDHQLLSIVQKGGVSTFSQYNGRHMLNATDLFKQGDTFTWEKYSKFLNKQAKSQELTNKGEEFPYEFKITELTKDSVTIEITKVK